MIYEINYLPFVFDDIKESKLFYEARKKGVGKDFVESVKCEFKKIEKNPLLFEIKYQNTRIALIDTFPIGIHFEIKENTNVIVVKGVYHTSRNPKIWNDRLL